MKSCALLVLLLVIAAAQAAQWTKVKSSIVPFPTNRKRSNEPSERIINGTVTTPGQLPYQAGIVLDYFGFCGGSLITPTVVLTAGHCVAGRLDFEVHLGAQNINEELEEGRVIVATRDARMHENYNPVSLTNDVGLIFLPEPVSGPNINTIRLPSRSQVSLDFTGSTIRISGWGRPADDNPALTDQLTYGDTEVISNEQCLLIYPGLIDSCHICFDTKSGTVGICNGDSGGPMVLTESDGEVTLLGITSFMSSESCQDGLPNGATRLTCHLDWLETYAGVQIRP